MQDWEPPSRPCIYIHQSSNITILYKIHELKTIYRLLILILKKKNITIFGVFLDNRSLFGVFLEKDSVILYLGSKDLSLLAPFGMDG